VFSVTDRDRVRDRVLEMAAGDPRVVGAAVVGGLADGDGDRWSDLDLISGVRDQALALACRRRGLAVVEGRGFDELPPEVLEPFDDTLVRSLEPEELRRALRGVVSGLLRESSEAAEVAASVEAQLRAL
jgi:hypothetical protein